MYIIYFGIVPKNINKKDVIMSNKLSGEKSPYLLQHKDNPVDWYPWCKEAFRKAKIEDKPIFLSIGYSTCHWCHVMAHESFEDYKTAELLESFVCIKVDREERPDIDAVYMNVCQALTGSGGWPLTIFMTPDQKPFFAGTYFPKTNRYGQIGFHDLLKQILHLWNNERESLIKSSDHIAAEVQRLNVSSDGTPDRSIIMKGYNSLRNSYDDTWGGFGRAPKFPTPHNLLFLLRINMIENEPKAMQMTEHTLQAMYEGGIFDHIGGGFSRYSTDEKWLVPHFEKMLYDNALLIIAYLEAFQLTKNMHYADIAKRTAEYILRELTDTNGGFYCGQDADSDGVEGKYYVFTPKEVIGVLGEEDGTMFCQMFNITDRGNFEGKSIPNRIGKSDAIWSFDDIRILKLFEYRKKRTSLHLDNKILLSWNAWTIIAFAKAGSVLNDQHYFDAAIKSYLFIKEYMTDEKGHLYLRFCDGEAANEGQLDDYSVYALALIELYSRTFEIKYLKEAILYAKKMIDLFEDREKGGFYMTAYDAEALITRPKEIYDGAIPSGNSVSAMVLQRLAELTGELFFREAADRQHSFLAGQIGGYYMGNCYALLSMSEALYPHKELICTGNVVPHDVIDYIKNKPLYDLSILYKSENNENELASIAPFTESYPISDHSVFYLCSNGACRKLETDFNKLNL